MDPLGGGGDGWVGRLSYKGDNIKGEGGWTPDNSSTSLAWINFFIFSPDQNIIAKDDFRHNIYIYI
jgi:hypothetical protein